MRNWNGRIVAVAILLLLAPIASASDDAADSSQATLAEGTPEAVEGPPGDDATDAAKNPPLFLAGFCTGQKQYDCTWPQTNCITALDAPGIDCATINKVCARVYYKDVSDGCCSTQGAYECIDSSACTPGGWWLNCSQLCGPCELP